jgi:hypothetical protein
MRRRSVLGNCSRSEPGSLKMGPDQHNQRLIPGLVRVLDGAGMDEEGGSDHGRQRERCAFGVGGPANCSKGFGVWGLGYSGPRSEGARGSLGAHPWLDGWLRGRTLSQRRSLQENQRPRPTEGGLGLGRDETPPVPLTGGLLLERTLHPADGAGARARHVVDSGRSPSFGKGRCAAPPCLQGSGSNSAGRAHAHSHWRGGRMHWVGLLQQPLQLRGQIPPQPSLVVPVRQVFGQFGTQGGVVGEGDGAGVVSQ